MQRRAPISIIEDYAKALDTYAENMAVDVTHTIAKDLQARYGDRYKVSVGNKYITLSRQGKQGPIDLKQGFRRSSSAKRKEGGGWYLVVPIRRTKMSLHHRDYTEARSMKVGQTMTAPNLFEGRKGRHYNQFNPYSGKRGKSLSKGRDYASGRNMYVSYRTVSDKSPADSWILNRDMDRDEIISDIRSLARELTNYRLRTIIS